MANEHAVLDVTSGALTSTPLSAEEQAAHDQAVADHAALLAAAALAAADDQTGRAATASLVQSCVGVGWGALSVAQKQALIVALLYRIGALDKSLTVRPLAAWLTREGGPPL